MNDRSYHSLTPKVVLSTVAHRDKTYDQDSLHWLCSTKACSDRVTTATRRLQVLKSPVGVTSHTENLTLLVFILCVSTILNHSSHVLSKQGQWEPCQVKY